MIAQNRMMFIVNKNLQPFFKGFFDIIRKLLKFLNKIFRVFDLHNY